MLDHLKAQLADLFTKRRELINDYERHIEQIERQILEMERDIARVREESEQTPS